MLVPRPPTWALGRSTVFFVDSAWSTTASSPNTITLWRSADFMRPGGVGDEAIRALARRQADAVGEVEQEDDVLAIHPPRQRRAAAASAPAAPPARRAPPAPSDRRGRTAAPRARRSAGASRAAPRAPAARRARSTNSGHSSRCRGTGAIASAVGPVRGRQRMRLQVRLLGVHEVDGHPQVAPRRRQGVEADLVGLREAHRAPGHRRLHACDRWGW